LKEMNMKAVILAAGLGSRIHSLNKDLPKSMLPLGDHQPSFLERQIQCLKKAGVSSIAVVVSYKKQYIYEALQDTDITIVENTAPDISKSGSLHSFQYAINSSFQPLDNKNHMLLLDGDIIYEQRVIDYLIQNITEESSILISPNVQQDSEEVLVYGHNNRPFFQAKGLTPSLVGNRPCLGEATGIIHYAPKDHTLVHEITDWLLGNPKAPQNTLAYKGYGSARQGTEHEELTQRLMQLDKIKAIILPKDYLFMEVDFATEYQYVLDTLYPQIKNADNKNADNNL